jgi:uncharacterized phage-associated protein
MKADSIELSKYVVAYMGPMNQMKLQKLLYFIECYHLACFNSSLFEDEFEAWMKGPISMKIWNYYKNLFLVFDPIRLPRNESAEQIEQRVKSMLLPEQFTLVQQVLDKMAGFTEYELECITRQDNSWKTARINYDSATICREIISKELMRESYAKVLNSH